MSGFVVVRHPDLAQAGVVPADVLELSRTRGWYRVSESREQPADFHLALYGPDAPDLDAPEPEEEPDIDDQSPATPDASEEQE